jgi:hypothetical protein
MTDGIARDEDFWQEANVALHTHLSRNGIPHLSSLYFVDFGDAHKAARLLDVASSIISYFGIPRLPMQVGS